jgi:glycosyltransferase involved in cell wall biosynthesis
VILTPGFPANEDDSTCVPPQQLFVKALKQVNPELNIIVLTFQYPFFSGEYMWKGIKVIAFGSPRNDKLSRLLTNTRVWHTLKKLQQENELIGLLSFWLGKCALVGNRFGKKHNVPHYCWLLGQDAKKGNKYVGKIKPKGVGLIALSDFIVGEFERNYGIQPQHLIPVGIDTSLFSNVESDRDIDVLGVGSLIPLKQYAVFIKVIKTLKETTPNIKAVLCGDGAEMQRLKVMIINSGLQDHITFTGKLAHKEVLVLMQRSKAFLHPSSYEGFGAVCLEALYAGVKVVSFVKPMNKDITNWYIAKNEAEMVVTLKIILAEQDAQFEKILPFPIQENAKTMLKLFGHRASVISTIRPAMALNER